MWRFPFGRSKATSDTQGRCSDTVHRLSLLPVFRFSPPHAYWAIGLFLTELVIAFFVHDRIVRPHLGDLLVVMLIHFAVRAVTTLPRLNVAFGALLFALLVEATQALDLIHRLGWEHSTAAHLLLGSTFQWWDVVAYAAGAFVALRIDRRYDATADALVPAPLT